MSDQNKGSITRREMLGGLLTAAAGTLLAKKQQAYALTGQQACAPTSPSTGFAGVIGKTATDSKPSLLEARGPRSGSPNIIYIVLDDAGFSDLHCYGSEIATANIDALASGGVIYSNFHTKAICSPSRASLLTGRNSHAVGVKELAGNDQGYPNSRGRITPAAATIAQILRASGYSTLGVGKWHLTPTGDMKPSGSRDHWPVQKGFERWYGFLSGWTDQYHPDLVEDNHIIERPNKPDYHFSADIVDQAIKMVGEHTESGASPDLMTNTPIPQQTTINEFGMDDSLETGPKPFFLYLAFGAMHAPVQVPKPYIEKYLEIYRKGWDRIRDERYQRQLNLGVIPPDTKLPPRNPGDPAWNDLTDEGREVYTHFMAAYAGFLEHTDDQIGRLIRFLKEKNLFENTLIFLLSDNGGAPEAGTKGGFVRPYGDTTSVHEMYQRLDDLGTEKTLPLYQRPWAMASNTPFKFYKLWPYRGGVQTPLVISWPARIRKSGLRKQFVDIIDITPTVLDIVGIEAPACFEGVCQIPMQGESISATFNDPEAPNPRNTQYFELWGTRGIWNDGWSAVGIHALGADFDRDRWELYHVEADFSQSVNLASKYPEKLEEMKKLWWLEAAKNGALPLLEPPFYRSHVYEQALEP